MVNLLICSLIYTSSLYVMMSMYSHITLSSMTTEYVPNDEHSCRPNVFIEFREKQYSRILCHLPDIYLMNRND